MSQRLAYQASRLPTGLNPADRVQLGQRPVVGRPSGALWFLDRDQWIMLPVDRFEMFCHDVEHHVALVQGSQVRVIDTETNGSAAFELGETLGTFGNVAVASPAPGVFVVGAATGVGGAIWKIDFANRDVLRRVVSTDFSAAELSVYRNTNEVLFSLSDGPGYTQEWKVGEGLSLSPCPDWFANVEVPRIAALTDSSYLYLGDRNDILVMSQGQVLKQVAMPEALGGSFLVADLLTFVVVGDKFGRLWALSKGDLTFRNDPLSDPAGHPVQASQVAAGPNNRVACTDHVGALHIWGL